MSHDASKVVKCWKESKHWRTEVSELQCIPWREETQESLMSVQGADVPLLSCTGVSKSYTQWVGRWNWALPRAVLWAVHCQGGHTPAAMTYFLPSGPHHRECRQSGPADPPSGTAHTVVNTGHFWGWNKITELRWCCFNLIKVLPLHWVNNVKKRWLSTRFTSIVIFQWSIKCLPLAWKSVTMFHVHVLCCGSYLANVPCLDVLQFHQKLIITACFELLDEYPAVRRLLVSK